MDVFYERCILERLDIEVEGSTSSCGGGWCFRFLLGRPNRNQAVMHRPPLVRNPLI
jgi:hypothetical protein